MPCNHLCNLTGRMYLLTGVTGICTYIDNEACPSQLCMASSPFHFVKTVCSSSTHQPISIINTPFCETASKPFLPTCKGRHLLQNAVLVYIDPPSTALAGQIAFSSKSASYTRLKMFCLHPKHGLISSAMRGSGQKTSILYLPSIFPLK